MCNILRTSLFIQHLESKTMLGIFRYECLKGAHLGELRMNLRKLVASIHLVGFCLIGPEK